MGWTLLAHFSFEVDWTLLARFSISESFEMGWTLLAVSLSQRKGSYSGPTARRKAPTQTAPRAKVNVQNISFVDVVGESILRLCEHIHSVQKPSLSQPNFSGI